MGLLGLESSEGPRLLAVIPGTSRPLYLGFFWVSWKGKEIHIPQSETFRLVCAEHIFSKGISSRNNIVVASKAEMSSTPIWRESPPHILSQQLDG